MAGLPQQTAASVLGTIDYCEDLLRRFGSDGRLMPVHLAAGAVPRPRQPRLREPG